MAQAQAIKKTTPRLVGKVGKKKPVANTEGAATNVTQMPAKPSALSNKAFLVGLSIGRWYPHITDKKISADVDEDYNVNAAAELGQYRKRLIGKKPMAKIRSIISRIRDMWNFQTLPWSDEGYRVIAGAQFFKFRDQFNALKAEYDEAVAEFLPLYPQLKAERKAAIGDAYNEADYPSAEALAAKFYVSITRRPLPAGQDFRVDIGDLELEATRREIEQTTLATVQAGTKEVWLRLQDVIGHAADRLKKYEVDTEGSVSHSFRDTLITNITDLLDVLPSLNILGDPALTKFEQGVRAQITAYNPEVLRDDAVIRKQVADSADAMLAKINDFLG